MEKLKNIFAGVTGIGLLQVQPGEESVFQQILSGVIALVTAIFQWKQYRKSKKQTP